MDTEFAKDFGARELTGVLERLSTSSHACERLLSALGPANGPLAVNMIRCGELVGEVGDGVHDFFVDEIENEAEDVWAGMILAGEEDNPETNYPVLIKEYCGVFFVSALEHESAGYFLSLEDALGYVECNWDRVREDP
ncbi:hypothetical protein DFR31_1289 [Alkalispirillum mobile]|uniref:Uncharacterized protein n=1 Tax=Alkalispirillum mobile TaxID=85925 RepID=A0A498C7I1_9GAMM|nr:hypothetical protein [Alkalispirillum mobile]RLK51353.1 hypothetical protein DFR31_1289 [Alkalispirillum mobile]